MLVAELVEADVAGDRTQPVSGGAVVGRSDSPQQGPCSARGGWSPGQGSNSMPAPGVFPGQVRGPSGRPWLCEGPDADDRGDGAGPEGQGGVILVAELPRETVSGDDTVMVSWRPAQITP